MNGYLIGEVIGKGAMGSVHRGRNGASYKRAASDARLTGTGSQLGTPEYMSPEQAEGKPADARSDLYGVGVLLYEMLTGEVPFQSESPVAVLHMQVNKEPAPLPNRISKRTRG